VEYELIIVRYGEIALKGKTTRRHFENCLISNIKNALNREQITHRIKKEWGRIYVYTNHIDKSMDVLQKIFGIVSMSPAVQTQSNMDSMSNLAVSISKDTLTEEKQIVYTKDDTFLLLDLNAKKLHVIGKGEVIKTS